MARNKTLRMKSHCYKCGTEHDTVSGLTGGREPKPGDVTMCIKCGEFGVFNKDLVAERPSPFFMLELAANEEIIKVKAAWEKAMREG